MHTRAHAHTHTHTHTHTHFTHTKMHAGVDFNVRNSSNFSHLISVVDSCFHNRNGVTVSIEKSLTGNVCIHAVSIVCCTLLA